MVRIEAVNQSKYVTVTVVRGIPASSADFYCAFLRNQLKCTGFRHDDGSLELLRVSCQAAKTCLDWLHFSERDLDFQIVG